MKYNVNEISSSEKEVEVSLPFDEIKDDIETEVKKQARSIQLPGFRKGKVPKHMLKKLYGDALEIEASEKIANDRFWKIAKENDLQPIGQPVMTDIDFKPGEDLIFKVKYETLPKIEVKNYNNLSIEVPDFKVKDEEIEREIEYIRKSNSTEEDADVVGNDNNYILDVEMFRLDDDGKPIDPDKPEKLKIDLTNESVHEDIKVNAAGKKVGDVFKFNFEDKRTVKNADGKEEEITEKYSYDIKINGIKKIVLPELNEELIKKATKDKVTTEEQLRSDIKKDLQNYYDQRVEEFTKNAIIGEILKGNPFAPPSVMVNNILEEMVKSEEERLKQQGAKKIDQEELRKYLTPAAENEVRWYLLKSEILKSEKIEVTDDDIKQLAEQDSEKTGIPVDKLLNYYKSSNQNEKLLDKKLFDFLKDKNNIKKVDPEKFSKSQKEEKNEE